jgi:hippurate hydrolase
MKALPLVFISSILAFASSSQAADDLRNAIAADYEENLEELYVHFHRNPELSNFEFETAKRLAEEIAALGYEDRYRGRHGKRCGPHRDDPG